ncbi:MAG: DUF692 domain-containing protein [Alphaproteobacteria bacterium]
MDRCPLDIPARAGVGLKADHYAEILADDPDVGWFEVHAENYMGEGGPPHHYLARIRDRYPISVHGVGLSIGAAHPLNRDHLARLKAVQERYKPGLISEHLAWSSHGGTYFPDLLPLPYTDEALRRVADHIDEVQDALGRQLLLENPSTYVSFVESTMTETAFLREIVRRTGCGLLLDVNNVWVSATNQGYSANAYIDDFPMEAVGEIHLAGHMADVDRTGVPLLIDSHDGPVADPVWALYRRAIGVSGPMPTLIEWDSDLPDWQTLLSEAHRADMQMNHALMPVAGPGADLVESVPEHAVAR